MVWGEEGWPACGLIFLQRPNFFGWTGPEVLAGSGNSDIHLLGSSGLGSQSLRLSVPVTVACASRMLQLVIAEYYLPNGHESCSSGGILHSGDHRI
jgi:hypothetical protein